MPSRNDNPAKNHNYDKILKFGGFYMPVLTSQGQIQHTGADRQYTFKPNFVWILLS